MLLAPAAARAFPANTTELITRPSGDLPLVAIPSGKSGLIGTSDGALQGGHQTSQDGRYIVFVLRNGVPTPVNVRTGLTDLDYSEVMSGVALGDSVLILPSASMIQSQQEFKQRIDAGYLDSRRPFVHVYSPTSVHLCTGIFGEFNQRAQLARAVSDAPAACAARTSSTAPAATIASTRASIRV